MRTSQLFGGIAFAAAVFSGSAAIAGPIDLPSGPIFGKFNGVEQVNINPGGTGFAATSGTTGADCTGCVAATGAEGSWGVFVATDLEPGAVTIPHQDLASAGPAFFNNGGGGATFGNQITGMFYGTEANVNPLTGVISGAGGILDLYWWDSNNQSQAGLEAENPTTFRTAQNQFTNVTCGTPVTNGATGCTFLAELDLVPGAVQSGPATIDTTKTVQSNSLNGSTGGNTGFYLEVDLTKGGAWAQSLAGQWFFTNTNGLALPDIADIFAQYDNTHCAGGISPTNGCPNWGSGPNVLGEEIHDPFKAFNSAVPEPATLTLLGTALLGLGARRRARNRK